MGRIVVSPDGRKHHVGGRKVPAKPHGLKLHTSRYGVNLQNWPATPASTAFAQAPAAQACLADVLGNDQVGDCTEANSYHLQALRQAAAGIQVYHPPVDVVLATYSRDGGYVVGDESTDNGCDETLVLQNALALGITNGTGVDCISGFVTVDASDSALVRACVSMFVGGAICAQLDSRWLAAASAGAVWSVPPGGYQPNPQDGHCFTLVDQTDACAKIMTWGLPIDMPWDALAACCADAAGGALYIEVDDEVLDAAQAAAPDGLDWACLRTDFAAFYGPPPIEPPGP